MFFTQLCVRWQYKYLHVHKEALNEKKKKNVYAFLIKKHLYMLDKAQNKKHLATAKQLIRKNSACCLKTKQFFSQSERTGRLDPLSPSVRFSSLFKSWYNSRKQVSHLKELVESKSANWWSSIQHRRIRKGKSYFEI